ncbi:MAG: UDP-3-O-acyl-N-acetylglucosamine deacetylase [Kiloniellales bacterium]
MKLLYGTAPEVVRQRTLKNSIHCSGIGVHSGKKVAMTLHPAPADSGIVFRRNDLSSGSEIKAEWHNAIETPLCTTVVNAEGVRCSTVEHLMSAFLGCGIDNAVVELDAVEVPIMDGSAAPFVFLIDCAGSVEQDSPRRALRILKEVTVIDGERSASLAPDDGFSVHFDIDFDSSVVARQSWGGRLCDGVYKREIARARTFGFLHEVDRLRAMGLARGGSLDNAIVIDGDKIMNEGGLRYPDEFVRHKVLDSIGDLFLAGGPILGRFHGIRAGHALTLRLLNAVMSDQDAWEWVDLTGAGALSGAAVPPVRAVAASA